MSLGLCPMTLKSCCRTCKHCIPDQSALFSTCKVRGIKIHHEVGVFAFCFHWCKKEPSLPIIKKSHSDKSLEKQLDFGKVLVTTEK